MMNNIALTNTLKTSYGYSYLTKSGENSPSSKRLGA